MTTADTYYAHSIAGYPLAQWERLDEHLRRVAAGDDTFPGAAGFADAVGARCLGALLGLWHDLGKYSPEFQSYLRSACLGELGPPMRRGSVDHATAGAQRAARRFGQVGRLMAYCIAGHHGGLPDHIDDEGGNSGLEDRLRKPVPPIDAAPKDVLDQLCPQLPGLNLLPRCDDRAFQASVLCRMLFSCLVDADYLATEGFLDPKRASGRAVNHPRLDELLTTVDQYLSKKMAEAEDTIVNRRRRDVLESCRIRAQQNPGMFSLTVPTGGGKTLSSLAFALTHAVTYGLRRVIYAIPFTSIIEQNAEVFRQALATAGFDAVLEHHSNLDPSRDTYRARLAAENWDRPLVVTTNVQLFESLFANRPGQCRKLHRIARSVIILDEVQTLPVELLQPTLAMLAELVRNYGCSVVLCTATQPAIVRRDDFPIGLEEVAELAPDPPGLYAALTRTDVRPIGPLADDTLADRLADHEQVLCVVNSRKHAAGLHRLLTNRNKKDVWHLSARMCPRHRSAVLRMIRRRLVLGRTCRVVSTQVVEAGVDIDFPVVYRAMAGLDSIAQAAGRCNREGRLARGDVYVFETDSRDAIPPPFVKQAAQDTREVMPDHANLLAPPAIQDYFRLHYWKRKDLWDKKGIMPLFRLDPDGLHAQFRQAAEKYRIIDDVQVPVIVPYGQYGSRLVEELERMSEPPGREFHRKLQRYVVTVRENELRQLVERGGVTCPFGNDNDNINVLADPTAYDRHLGLQPDVGCLNPENLVL